MLIVGLDLAGMENTPTGFSRLIRMTVETCLVYSDTEILAKIEESHPAIVVIDAPFIFPPGRKTLEEKPSSHLRECDRELLRKGIKFFPVTLGPMRQLTKRGINLKRILAEQNVAAVEAYPGGAQDVLGIT